MANPLKMSIIFLFINENQASWPIFIEAVG